MLTDPGFVNKGEFGGFASTLAMKKFVSIPFCGWLSAGNTTTGAIFSAQALFSYVLYLFFVHFLS